MNLVRPLVCVLCLTGVACAPMCSDDPADSSSTNFPELRGPYLGQELPGLEPRLFAPGAVSTGLATRDVAMTPDGDELFFMSSRTTTEAGLPLTGSTINELLGISAQPGQGSSDIWWVSAEVIERMRP